jgi:hypothetical protein
MPLLSLVVVGQKSAWDQLNALTVHNIYHTLVFFASRQECPIWGGGGLPAFLISWFMWSPNDWHQCPALLEYPFTSVPMQLLLPGIDKCFTFYCTNNILLLTCLYVYTVCVGGHMPFLCLSPFLVFLIQTWGGGGQGVGVECLPLCFSHNKGGE